MKKIATPIFKTNISEKSISVKNIFRTNIFGKSIFEKSIIFFTFRANIIYVTCLFFTLFTNSNCMYENFCLYNKTGLPIRANVDGVLAQIEDGKQFRFDVANKTRSIDGITVKPGTVVILWTNTTPIAGQNSYITYKTDNINRPKDIFLLKNGEYLTWTWDAAKNTQGKLPYDGFKKDSGLKAKIVRVFKQK